MVDSTFPDWENFNGIQPLVLRGLCTPATYLGKQHNDKFQAFLLLL
jgi:hypothetical protein